MCRLVGVVSSETTDFGFSLRHAPKSLESLSREHPHGWGVAVHDRDGAARDRDGHGWEIHREAACARDDDKFGRAAATARGRLLVAHIRKATVGPTSASNTHPFRRGAYVFAHNGTIRDVAWVVSRTSAERRREVEGDTDSERFFAYLLTAIDELGALPAIGNLDAALLAATTAATARPDFGSLNFLFGSSAALYTHRFGRTLFLLERGRGDRVRPARVSGETEAVLSTPWSPRRVAALVASEAMSDEPWQEIPERALFRADVVASPTWQRVAASEDRASEATAP